MKINAYMKEIIREKLSVSYFAKGMHAAAFPVAIDVVERVESVDQLSEQWHLFFKDGQLAVCNLISRASQVVRYSLDPEERIPFNLEEQVDVPKGSHYEKATIIAIENDEDRCLVRPLRAGAETFYICADLLHSINNKEPHKPSESLPDEIPGQTNIYQYLN